MNPPGLPPHTDTLTLLAQGKVGLEALKDLLPAERWPDLLNLLQTATAPNAILFAAKNLNKIFTEHWNLFSMQQRSEIRLFLFFLWTCCTVERRPFGTGTFMLGYLYNKGSEFSAAATSGTDPGMNSALIAVLQSLVQLLCRLCKLTWIDDKEHDISITEFSKFFEVGLLFCAENTDCAYGGEFRPQSTIALSG